MSRVRNKPILVLSVILNKQHWSPIRFLSIAPLKIYNKLKIKMRNKFFAGSDMAQIIVRYIINIYSFILFGMVVMLIGTPFSLVFASSWNIQTIEHWGDNGLGNSIALDSLGRVNISYIEFDYLAGKYYIKYAFMDGNTWKVQYVAQAGDLSSGGTSLVLDSNDRPRICYTYSRLGYRPILGYANWNGSTWELWGIDYGTSGSLSLDVYDMPHISYSNPYSVVINKVIVPHSDLKYAYLIGQNWQTQTIEYGGRIGEESSLALDSQMRPHIAYRDFGIASGQLKYAAWNGSAWQIHVVDNQGDAGKNPSLALDSADRPHISYAGGDYSLKYASFNDASWQIQTIDASVALYSLPNSLVLDKNDRPHISYQNNGLSILKYAVWNDSGWRIEIVDGSNSPGLYNSIAIDSGNRPHISYYEVIDGDLKYATVNIAMQDSDGDGVPDSSDNCTLLPNSNQRDTDHDGFGNVCDADLNNDMIVNAIDLGLFKKCYLKQSADAQCQNPQDADINGDGIANAIDLGLFKKLYLKPPGPRGLIN
jgi:hypothetical protein